MASNIVAILCAALMLGALIWGVFFMQDRSASDEDSNTSEDKEEDKNN